MTYHSVVNIINDIHHCLWYHFLLLFFFVMAKSDIKVVEFDIVSCNIFDNTFKGTTRILQ